jgi:hypothetical protein
VSTARELKEQKILCPLLKCAVSHCSAPVCLLSLALLFNYSSLLYLKLICPDTRN